eukprot:4677253-Amphidinium_carterae.1
MSVPMHPRSKIGYQPYSLHTPNHGNSSCVLVVIVTFGTSGTTGVSTTARNLGTHTECQKGLSQDGRKKLSDKACEA